MILPTKTLRALPLMVEHVRRTTVATVETSVTADVVSRLPLVLVQVDGVSPVRGGAPQWGATFRSTLTAMASTRWEAMDLAHQVVDGLLDSWRSGLVTEHGWVSHLSVVALPFLSSQASGRPDAGAAGVWAFTAVLDVVARH